MRALTLHLKILITILVVLGISITAYQIFVLGIPVTEDATDDLWNIDAKVEFVASSKDPVKIQMFVPPLNRDYVSLNESFISNNYGVSVNRVDGNRKVTWSARQPRRTRTPASLVSGPCRALFRTRSNMARLPGADVQHAPTRRRIGQVVGDQQGRDAQARNLLKHEAAKLHPQRGIQP